MPETHSLDCPHCRVALVMSERQGIEIDYCPRCRGVWLDRGELDKIIERNAQYQAAPAPQQPQPGAAPWGGGGGQPQYGQPYREEHGGYGHGGKGHHGRKHRSFLGDLFD